MKETKQPNPMLAVLLVILGYFASTVAGQLVAIVANLVSFTLAAVLYCIVEIAVFTLFVWLAAKQDRVKLPAYGLVKSKRAPALLAVGLVLGLMAVGLVCLPLYGAGRYTLEVGEQRGFTLFLGLVNYIVIGYEEELLCRGFILYRFGKSGPIKALCFTALIFSLLHLLNPGFTVLSFINVFLAGAFMGAVLYAFNSLPAAIGVHITWNWLQGSVLGIPVSGTNPDGFFATTVNPGNSLITGGSFGAEGSIFCTIVLVLLSAAFLFIAHKNGNLAQRAAQAKEMKEQAEERERLAARNR